MPEAPATPKGRATQRRILDAAREEFAANGIAGARIDRIIRSARTNKAQVYGYFGSKEGLFDAVMADAADRMVTAVPFEGDDLADWAVGLYDESVARPEMVRLTAWLRLERRPSGALIDSADHEAKLAAIAAAQAAGRIRAGEPYDLMALVIALALTWSPISGVHAASAEDPEADHARRRALLRETVRRALAP